MADNTALEERVESLEQRGTLDRMQYRQILKLAETNTSDMASLRTEMTQIKNDVRALGVAFIQLRTEIPDIIAATVAEAFRDERRRKQ